MLICRFCKKPISSLDTYCPHCDRKLKDEPSRDRTSAEGAE